MYVGRQTSRGTRQFWHLAKALKCWERVVIMKQVLKNASRVLLAFAALLGTIGVNAAEWDCAHTTSSNEYTLGTNCQISGGDVEVTTALEITGNFTNLENLVEVLAADNNRHFTVSSGTLTIRYLKLLGGRAGEWRFNSASTKQCSHFERIQLSIHRKQE